MFLTTQHPQSRTKEEFVAALKQIRPKLTAREIGLLGFHMRSEGRISARDAAEYLQRDHHGAGNFAYGRLAAKFCELLGRYETEEGRSDCLFLLVSLDYSEPDGEVRWIIRPAFAEALDESGIIPKEENA